VWLVKFWVGKCRGGGGGGEGSTKNKIIVMLKYTEKCQESILDLINFMVIMWL